MLARTTRGTLVNRSSRALSSRASQIIGALDIPTSGTPELAGVYDGAWTGSGDILESKCPSTGEILARVKTVCIIHVNIYALC
jgi:aldehyde dehydrogenase family 7 protein A1